MGRNKNMPTGFVTHAFLDIETTGLEPSEGAVILSVGFVLNKGEQAFEATLKPTTEEWNKANPKALEVNGMTWEYLQEHGVSLDAAKDLIVNYLLDNHVLKGDAIFVGQNPGFDIKFLRHYMGAELEWIGAPLDDVLDNIYLFKSLCKVDPELKKQRKFNTHAMSQALGVPEEPEVHNALEGAKAAMRNYWAIWDRRKALWDQTREEDHRRAYDRARETWPEDYDGPGYRSYKKFVEAHYAMELE